MRDLVTLTNQVSMTSKDIERLMDKGIIAHPAMAFMQETKYLEIKI